MVQRGKYVCSLCSELLGNFQGSVLYSRRIKFEIRLSVKSCPFYCFPRKLRSRADIARRLNLATKYLLVKQYVRFVPIPVP